jgi:hypothetical protein
MPSADRATTLSQMIALREPIAVQPRAVAAKSYIAYWQANRRTEDEILDLVELACILQADRFAVPQVFERLRKVYDLPAMTVEDARNPLHACLIDHLGRHHAAYLEPGTEILTAAMTIAQPWAETYAEVLVASSWPPQEMLGDREPEGLEALAVYGKAHLGRDVRRLRARALAGDQVHSYSTAPLMWTLMMGSGGFALVRDGRSVDYLQTRMN